MSEQTKYFDLKAPEIPAKITVHSPKFDGLAYADKLNDSEYRSVIYQKFPNEPMCACSKNLRVDGLVSIGKCPGGCTSDCCNGARSPIAKGMNNANDSRGTSRSLRNYNGPPHPSNGSRMRGGGGGCEELYRKWEDLDCSRVPRGQNILEYSSPRERHINRCIPPMANEVSNYFHTPPLDYMSSKAYANGQDSLLNSGKCKKGAKGCSGAPCTGAECFIRSLQETQEFVNSLGKVPGLAGLGLQDPSDSPYFHTRDPLKDVDPAPLEESKHKRRVSKNHDHQRYQNTNDPGLINTKPFTLPSSAKRGSLLASPLRLSGTGLNRQKSEEVLEGTGPCGESCCKSRRKVNPATSSSHDLVKPRERERRASKRGVKPRGLGGRKHKMPDLGEERRSTRRKIKYVYVAGDTYPGGTFGHKNCNDPRKRVPANMGWLWNEYQALGRLKPRVGWRPGAISRTMKEIIKEARAGALEDARSRSALSRSRLKNRSQTSLKKSQSKRLDDVEEEPPATLHILRRDGTYYVTMYPIKQENMEIPQLEEPMKPMQFKIMKDKEDSGSESSTASDIEIEFSPPAAVSRYRKKPDVVHVDVQVRQQEILDAFKPVGEKMKGKKGKK